MKLEWLKHAFAIEPPGIAEPTEEQFPVVNKVCAEIVRRRMTLPALAFIEMLRPLNNVGSQLLVFFQPFLDVFTDSNGPKLFAEFLEHRGSIDYLCNQIELMEQDRNPNVEETTNSDAKRMSADGEM